AGGGLDDLPGGRAMVETFRRPLLFSHSGALAVHYIKAGRHADLFHLTAEQQTFRGIATIERELDAGGTGIDHRQATACFVGGFRHGITVLARPATTSRLATAQDRGR